MKPTLSLVLLVSAFAVRAQVPAEAPGEFVVGDIRVEGLQRISEGAVFNALPVNIGDRIGASRVREALRALNDTGFFRDVELRRDESALIVVVQERPSIRTFDVKGNKELKSDDLATSLRSVDSSPAYSSRSISSPTSRKKRVISPSFTQCSTDRCRWR